MAGASNFELPPGFTGDDLNDFFRWAANQGASDITIQSGDHIFCKIKRVWVPVTARRLDHAEVERVLSITYGETGAGQLNKGFAPDYRINAVIDRDTVIGFRANATACRVGDVAKGISLTARTLPDEPVELESLKLESDILDNLFPRYGLILVVGTTGSGKSTLLSAANAHRARHRQWDPVRILTYEDPVETTYGRSGLGVMPLVSQVEIAKDGGLRSFSEIGRNAMRRTGDVITVGELRDRETVEAGFEMALTGHCVMATLHVDTPAQVVDRMVSFFPVDGQPAAANKLMSTLKLVVAQKILPLKQGGGQAVRSWHVFDRETKRELGRRPYHEWQQQLQDMCEARGATFEDRVLPLLVDGLISFEVFRDATGFTPRESLDFLRQRGVDWRAFVGEGVIDEATTSLPAPCAVSFDVLLKRARDLLSSGKLSFEGFAGVLGLEPADAMALSEQRGLHAG